MNITIEGVRIHIERGTLRQEKAPDGTVHIVLDDYQTSLRGVQTSPDDRPYPAAQAPEEPALVDARANKSRDCRRDLTPGRASPPTIESWRRGPRNLYHRISYWL
ncbi:MAG: hypothetical protein JOZ19_04830 [Rubrobacter sp.]|nr:hypothetical protein [Rubrobacter sp.]